MNVKKLISIYMYIFLASILTLNVFSLVIFIGIRFFFWFALNISFELPGDDLLKYCKASTLVGAFIASASSWIYYRRYK